MRSAWVLALALTVGVVSTTHVAKAEALQPLDGQVRFRGFGSAEGLRNIVVVSVVQDASGSVWVGTEDGLYRYDGQRFERLGVEHGLPSNRIVVVGLAPNGAVCAGTNGGLVCWNDRRFEGVGLPEVSVLTFATAAGRLWVGTERGLYVSDASGGGAFAPAAGWPGRGRVKALWGDAHGVVAADDGSVFERTVDGNWRAVPGMAGDRVDGVLRDRAGGLWIRSALHMWHVPRGAARAEEISDGLPPGYDTVDIPQAMALDPRGDVWVATDRGIVRRDGARWRLLDQAAGLPVAGARMLYFDREGTMWVGAIGLLQLRGRGLIERFDREGGLPGGIAWSIRRDRAGTLWVGTNECLARFVAGAWACLPGTENRVVRSFVFAPQGGVFLGGAPSDLLYVDAAGAAHSLGAELALPANHAILALTLGTDGSLWIATKVGLYRLPGAVPGPFERIAIPGIPENARHSALLERDGRLWSATSHGLVVREDGRWSVLGVADGLRAAAVQYVTASQGGRVCIGYTEGLGISCFAWDGHAVSALEHLGVADGMTSGMVYSIGEDRRGRLWLGTGDGVDVVTPTGIDHFTDRDGLAGNDATAMGFFEDLDGAVWIGSTGGLTRIAAASYDGPLAPPHVVIRSGSLGDQAIGTHAAGLATPHDRNALTIELGVDTPTDADRVELQLRLAPLEDAWTTTQLRQARYPALPPGSYTLEVRARIGAGRWGPLTTVAFVVEPPWWKRWWFIASCALLAIGAIALGFTWRQRALLKQRTRQLKARSDATLRALLEFVPDMISVTREGKITYVNRAARRFHGIADGAEMPDLGARMHPDDIARFREVMTNARATGPNQASEMIEVRTRGAEPEWRIVEVSCAWFELDDATVLLTSGRDVTERHRMRTKLVMADRMASLGTLAAGVAHEINNPLAYVIGNLEHASEALASNAPGGELATVIADAMDGAERVRRIVRGLRSFSRTEEDPRAVVDLAQVLEAAIRMTSNEVRHRARLVREIGPMPRVSADDGQLTQVFINLLVNAAHAIPEGHSDENEIAVRTRTDDDGRAVIEIADTGRGMAPDVLARAFDPFFTTKGVGEGTGLGLSICHGIISALGGTIAIDSVLGRGTTVRIVLPPGSPVVVADVAAAAPVVAGAPIAADAADAADAPGVPAVAVVPIEKASEAPPAIPARRSHVLVVDDEPMVGETLGRALRRDHDVTIASCGQAALDHIAVGTRFDAIVSDVMMPNMTGLELLDTLTRIAPEQAKRLIFLSGGVFTSETRAALDALGTVQLEKPVSARELRACVMRVVSSG